MNPLIRMCPHRSEPGFTIDKWCSEQSGAHNSSQRIHQKGLGLIFAFQKRANVSQVTICWAFRFLCEATIRGPAKVCFANHRPLWAHLTLNLLMGAVFGSRYRFGR
jgi:hypothetical protein